MSSQGALKVENEDGILEGRYREVRCVAGFETVEALMAADWAAGLSAGTMEVGSL